MKNGRFFYCYVIFLLFFNLAGKMAKQTLVFESPKELSLKDNMIVIKDRDTEEMTSYQIPCHRDMNRPPMITNLSKRPLFPFAHFPLQMLHAVILWINK